MDPCSCAPYPVVMATTPICFCGKTAYRYWHSLRTDGPLRLGAIHVVPRASERLGIHPTRTEGAPHKCPNEEEFKTAARLLANPRQPLDLLVATPAARRNNHLRHCAVWSGPLPRGSLVRIDTNVFVCTPEFLALQWATSMDLLSLTVFLYELAGTYALGHWGCEPLLRCSPLLAPDALHAFTNRASGAKGVCGLRKAAGFLHRHSGSPMETMTVLLLCLPRKYGGYGLPFPHLNERVAIAAPASATGMPHDLFCDLYWPGSKVAVEYDGVDFHSGFERVHRDYVRANELQAMGVSIDVLTKRELFDGSLFDAMAHRVAHKLGFRLRKQAFDATWRARHRNLRNRLRSLGEAKT